VAALWLYQRETNFRELTFALTFALILLALLRLFGKVQRRGEPRNWLLVGLSILTVVGAVAQAPSHASAIGETASGAERWSQTRVDEALREHHPVLVYFTADWCLSCKVNETTSIDRDEVRDAFRKAGVKVLAGDWTNGDPEITRFLESRGRAGVPLYLWYAPGKPPQELPQVLTPGMLIARARSFETRPSTSSVRSSG